MAELFTSSVISPTYSPWASSRPFVTKLYAPAYISWNGADSIISPMPSDLANGDNWKIVNDGETAPSYINDKIIPFERIRTLG